MKNTLNIIKEAILVNVLVNQWDTMEDDLLDYLCQVIDYNKIPDNILAHESMRDFIRWDRLGKYKMVRLVARDMDILPLVDLGRHKFSIRELRFILPRRPELIEEFDVDLSTLTKDEALSLLEMNKDYFSSRIDISKYTLRFNEVMEVVRKHNYDRGVLADLDLDLLTAGQIMEIAINTQNQNVDMLNLKKLTATHWLNILDSKPELFPRCNLDIFRNSDIYNTVKLITTIKNRDVSQLLIGRSMREISAHGWEKLIIHDPSKYLEMCELGKLTSRHWKTISQYHPELGFK